MQSPIDLHTCKMRVEVPMDSGEFEDYNIPVERPAMKPAYNGNLLTTKKICEASPETGEQGCFLRVTPKILPGVGTLNMITAPGLHSYHLEYCDVRMPSEHLVNGHTYPLETQCVHTVDGTDEHRHAIIATLYERGMVKPENDEDDETETSSYFIQKLLEHMPNSTDPEPEVQYLNFVEAMGTAGLTRFYTYKGSFTHGHCEEDVDWFVMYDPTGISKEQIDRMNNAFPKWLPSRSTQPAYGRHPDGCHHEKVPEDAASPAAIGAFSFALALLSLSARS